MPDPKYQVGDIIRYPHSSQAYYLVKKIVLTGNGSYYLYHIKRGTISNFDMGYIERQSTKV
jgi:hypothetical protein